MPFSAVLYSVMLLAWVLYKSYIMVILTYGTFYFNINFEYSYFLNYNNIPLKEPIQEVT